MSTRLRITFIFGMIVFLILLLVCGSVYYFSYTSRLTNIRTRLTNRAITTSRLLSRSDIFDQQLLRRIDGYTMLAMKDKTLEAYDFRNNKIYSYSDHPNDTLTIEPTLLDDARVKGSVYFSSGKKESVAYHYTDDSTRIVVVSAAYDKEGREKLDQLRLILLLSFSAGIVAAFSFGYVFSRELLVPIRKIADDIEEISARDLTRRIPVHAIRDEWYYLSDTMNKLLDRLQESFEMQRRFIANASHELSTPLASIYSQLDVSLQKDRSAEEYRQVVQSVYQDVRHLNKLTLTLLEFAHASGDAGGLVIKDVRIDEIVLLLPSEVRKMNPTYRVILNFDHLPQEQQQLVVAGNGELLFLAIKNVVVNACKYSDDHTARLKLWVTKNLVNLSVEDNGAGIEKTELSNIFQPFYRVSDTSGVGGFGLGLSLAAKIFRLHKGGIQVESEPGKGTIFTIMFPVANI